MKKLIYILRCCLVLLCMMTASAVMAAKDEGGRLLDKADSLYAVQQYKSALEMATKALPLTKGTDLEGDCLNLLAVINIRLSDYDEAAKYAKQCYVLDEKSGDPDMMSSSLNTLAAANCRFT